MYVCDVIKFEFEIGRQQYAIEISLGKNQITSYNTVKHWTLSADSGFDRTGWK